MPIPSLQTQHPEKKTVISSENVRKKRAKERASIEREQKKTASQKNPTLEHKNKKESVVKKPEPHTSRFRKFLAWWTWKRIAWSVGSVVGFCVVVGGATAIGLYTWVSKDLADVTDVEKRAVVQSTKIYARDGQTLLYEIGDNKRQDTTLDNIDKKIQEATIALEDRQFYSHPGINIKGIIRALVSNITNKEITQGASTLTQQFISNAILEKQDRTYTRKLKEAILAFRLERKYSKDEILNMYLNEVYYGANYQGIEVAAQVYFGKSAKEVSLAEAATLASLPNNPIYLPRDPERLQGRRNYAIDIMVEMGYTTTEEAEVAKAEPVVLLDEVNTEIKAPHFVFYIADLLEEEYGQARIRRDGFTVITSLDIDKQHKAEEAIRNGIAKVEQYGGDNAALVSIDTHTGQILAMVGSRDFFDEEHEGQYNVATSYNRQPGSSFKPIVYYTAFSKGFTPDTRLYDVVTDFPIAGSAPYRPLNFNGAGDQRGAVTLRYALNQSLNIPAVKLMYLTGKDTVLDVADGLGYTSLKDRESFGAGLALALGAGNVSLLEHTSTFATFAREGERHPPAGILSIKDRNGASIYEWVDQPTQVLNKDAARTLNNVLSDSSARGATFARLNLNGRPVAAKTGTSNDFKDAWAMGYTPSIATGIWTGRNDNQPMDYLGDGIIIAAPIFKAYMDSVLDGSPVETFQSASYTTANPAMGGSLEKTVTKSVDAVTGGIIPDECIATYPSQYVRQREFKEAHTILYFIDKNNPTGGAPKDPNADPMYASWERAVQGWIKKNKASEYLTEDTPKVECNYRDPAQQPQVSITSLENGALYAKAEFRMRGLATPGSGRTITEVSFIIDDITVERLTGQSIRSATEVSSSYRPKTLTNGRHGVTMRVVDDRGNVATHTITVRYNGEEETPPPANTNTNTNTNSNTNTPPKTNNNTNSSTNTNS